MNNEQNDLRKVKPLCSFCFKCEEEVKILVKVHNKYICDSCCMQIKALMDKTDSTPPDNEPRKTA